MRPPLEREAEGLAVAGSSRLVHAQRAVQRFYARYPWYRGLRLGIVLFALGVFILSASLHLSGQLADLLFQLVSGPLILVTVSMTVLETWKQRRLHALIREEKHFSSPVCPECGYDTRGLQGPRCPECGTLLQRD